MPTFPTTIPAALAVSSSSTAVLDRTRQIGLGGRAFLVDLRGQYPRRLYSRQSAPLQRQQFDQTHEAGEQSFGDGWWRRSQSDFSGGAGQIWLDKEGSNRTRFKLSKGVDVFTTAPEVTLLRTTASARASTATNLFLLRVESGSNVYAYVADNQTLARTADPFAGTPSFTSITGGPAAAIQAITSSGQYVYAAYSANGIYRHDVSGTTTAAWSVQNATLVRWVKQRIMAANANILYECDSAGTATARYTHWNSSFVWTDITDIGPAILAAGYIGEKSTIFRSVLASDGTLGTFVEAIEGGLPDGEIINTITSYLSYIFIGTNRGVRLGVHDAEGNVTYGPLVPVDTTINVKCFEPDGAFCWFGWTNYDGTSTGLGRLDLRTFTASLRPAYASDLMATTQGAVLSVCTHTSKRVFAVSGVGFYSEQTTYVASGTLRTCRIGYGTTEDKIAKSLTLNSLFATETIVPSIAGSNDSFGVLGTASTNRSSLTVGTVRDAVFSLSFAITSGSSNTTTPTFRDYTLKALPAVAKQRIFQVPLLLFDTGIEPGGIAVGAPGQALSDLEFLEALENTADTVRYEDLTSGISGTRTFDVLIESIEFSGHKEPELGRGFGGPCVVTLRTVS